MRRASLAIALCMLPGCAGPPPSPPAPVVQLAPAEGTVLTVDVFRLPDGVTWDEVVAYCADGLRRPGDIEVRDRRSDAGAAAKQCFHVAWANGLPQTWDGCGGSRGRRFELTGVAAARALTGTWVADRARNQLWRMPANIAVDALGEAGWWDDASALTEREWAWMWAKRDSTGARLVLEAAARRLPADRAAALHAALVRETIGESRRARVDGDVGERHRCAAKLATLGELLPAGASAGAFMCALCDAGALDDVQLATVSRMLRRRLVAERAYAQALLGDVKPVDAFLDRSAANDLVAGVARAVPSGLLPAPSTATAAEKWAVKEGAARMMDEAQRAEGLLLYEALVGTERTAEAERLARELRSRYPVKPMPVGDSPEDVALRRLLEQEPAPIDLDSGFRRARERAKGATAEAADPPAS